MTDDLPRHGDDVVVGLLDAVCRVLRRHDVDIYPNNSMALICGLILAVERYQRRAVDPAARAWVHGMLPMEGA
jgi:hypothetical protein